MTTTMMRLHVELPHLHDLAPVVERRGGLRPLPTVRRHAFPDARAGVAGNPASPEDQAVRLKDELDANARASDGDPASRFFCISPFCQAHTQIGWADDRIRNRGPDARDVLASVEADSIVGSWTSALYERIWLSAFAKKSVEIGLTAHTLFVECEELWGPWNLWVDRTHPHFAERSQVIPLLRSSTLAMRRMSSRLRLLMSSRVLEDPAKSQTPEWREAVSLLSEHMARLVTRGIRELVRQTGLDLIGVAGEPSRTAGLDTPPSVRVLQYPCWQGSATVLNDGGWPKSTPVPDARCVCADEYAWAAWSVERLTAMIERARHAGVDERSAVVPWLNLRTPIDMLRAQLAVCRAKGVCDVGLHGSVEVSDKPAMLAALAAVAEFNGTPGKVVG